MSLAAQAPVQWFLASTASADHKAGTPWLQLLDTATLSTGRYRLPKNGKDSQSPHDRDEVYFVVAGKAMRDAPLRADVFLPRACWVGRRRCASIPRDPLPKTFSSWTTLCAKATRHCRQ
jgi:hypothetical protein